MTSPPPPESSNDPLPFEYESLVEDDEIRLLHLQPGIGDGDVRFSLHTVKLDDNPSYEALSYCWGDSNDTRLVYCEGMSLQITYSLFTALKHLRQSGEERVIWADAVCINQNDIAEKSAQVQLMSRIYSQPSRVLIWLGNDMDGLDGLHECLKGASELLPPEDNIEFEFLYQRSKTLFRETFVSPFFAINHTSCEEGDLMLCRNCEQRGSRHSSIMTGRLMPT